MGVALLVARLPDATAAPDTAAMSDWAAAPDTAAVSDWAAASDSAAAPDTTAALDSSRTVHAMDQARLPKTKAAGGRRTGMIIGGIAGAGFGVLLGIVVNALDDDPVLDDAAGWATWVGASTLAGLGAGALLGTLLGSMMPAAPAHQPAATPRSEPGADSPGRTPPHIVYPHHRTGPIGSVTLELAGAGFPAGAGGDAGIGGRILLQAHRGPRFRIGIEHGRLYTAPRFYSTGLTARVATLRGLYLVGGVGFDHWSSVQNLRGASLGVAFEPGEPAAYSGWVVEGRWHLPIENHYVPNGGLNVVSLAVGRRFGW